MPRRLRRRTWVALGVLAVAAFAGLREAGALGFDLNTSVSDHSFRSEHDNDARFKDVPAGSTTVVFEEQAAGSEFDEHDVEALPRSREIEIRVDPFEIQGCYWLPLLKSGSCSYRAQVFRGGAAWGSTEGELQLSVRGFSSARSFRESVRADIRKQLTGQVEKWTSP